MSSRTAAHAMQDSKTPEVAPDWDEQMGAYSDAVGSGMYQRTTGLVGKYDNVRRYWEDELTRNWIRPHLARLIKRRTSEMKRLRIMDLGCGSGDGYELLMNVRRTDPSLTSREVRLITDEILDHYKGVDLNEDLLRQAEAINAGNPKIRFAKGDFSEGLPVDEGEPPYDLYVTSYGTLSHHNDDETLVRMLVDMAKHTKDYCLLVGDWLGRYSYEWQTLWTNNFDECLNMDYVISYIYDEKEREELRDEMQHIYLRLMTQEEVMKCVRRASDQAGVEIKPLHFSDRSLFTGRHMDTAEYNPHAQPMRSIVNGLHEDNYRVDLSQLLINYVPRPGFDFLNSFFGDLQMRWNTLVTCAQQMLDDFDPDKGGIDDDHDMPASYPKALKTGIERLRSVINGVGWLHTGLPRENMIEPQLGYELRGLVSDAQKGFGCGHGLVGIFEIDKT